MNIISFILIIFRRIDVMKRERAIRYFFIQGLGSAIFIGIFYLGGEETSIIIPVIIMYKMGGAPFYFWFPSVCERVSWGVCLVLITIQKVIPLILLRMVTGSLVWVLGVLRIVVGGVGSLNQMKMKRLLAFSSIHHVGLVVLSLKILEKI